MRRKRILITAALLSAMISITACGTETADKADNAAAENTELTGNNTEAENAGLTENTEPAENTGGSGDADSSSEETPEATDPIEEYNKNYDYLLYSDSDPNAVILGFNYPYKAEYINNRDFAPSSYEFSTEDYYFGEEGNFYHYSKVFSISSYSELTDDTDMEEKGEIETPYGTAKLYSAGDSKEVAMLNADGNTVRLCYRDEKGSTEYLGELEKLIPILFAPVEIPEEQKTVIEQNNVKVEDSYEFYLLGGYNSDSPRVKVLGFNSFGEEEGWGTSGGSRGVANGEENVYRVYCMREHVNFNEKPYEEQGECNISVMPSLYNYFFGGRGTVSLEEKGSVQTPFGEAKVFSATRLECEVPVKEEVAVLNNRGNNIIFEYQPYKYDCEYEGRLETLIPMLFE